MTNVEQRAKLQAQILKIADDVHASVNDQDFKQYILGTLFYRFISENFADYMKGGDESVNYAEVEDNKITEEIKEDTIKTKGYFIYPSQLFCNVAKTVDNNENLNTDLAKIFSSIENSANGYPSEKNIKGLFADFVHLNNNSKDKIKEKNKKLAIIIKGIKNFDIGNFNDIKIDFLGDAYEFLMSKYTKKSGKLRGEYFTPQCVSKLLAKIVILGQNSINKVYDPTCGTGSLLIQFKKEAGNNIEEGFFGQEINPITYNLARMNMFLHNVSYDKFNIVLGDTLINPQFKDKIPFDAIVSNPPYSIKWAGKDDQALINDERFAPVGALAPKSKADFAFVLHSLHYLSNKGRAAIVAFPGIFYRDMEKKIRKYLIDNNFIEAIIVLPPNLFYNTSISVNILVLSKNKKNTKTQFIDASGEEFYKKATKNNILEDKHIDKIIEIFDKKEDIKYVAKSVDNDEIAKNDYNLSVSSYVERKDTREKIDINKLNTEIKETVAKINKLRAEIDESIEVIES